MKHTKRALATTAAVAAFTMAAATPASAIVDGHDAGRLPAGILHLTVDYPEIGRTLACGAGLYPDRYHVVTAAHCLSDQLTAPTVVPVQPSRVHVRGGSLDRTTGGQTANGTQVTLHPDWSWVDPTSGKPVSDIAQLALDRPLDGPVLKVAAAPSKPGSQLQLVGWGLTAYPPDPDDANPLPENLQERHGSQLQDRYCGTEVGVMTEGDVCMTKGGCFGDSGTPVLKENPDASRVTAVAVFSRETDSATPCDHPIIGTSIPYFSDWLLAKAACTPKGMAAGACPPSRTTAAPKRATAHGRVPQLGSVLQPAGS
ncbi:trypsin-like serine protease [Actinoplanes sp. NBRC 103695]|uniref:S1 family peptidase n=1 Tax=Actinoplanes sp. NBRC 103695 TaxID=3032202 RepID=UPI0024A5051D|nr:trypsin-like serine protease [Actinoplanes sp. NBRC 103695]GLY96553.1 serine protease [Actinoplanes sp. NBRC 103695]